MSETNHLILVVEDDADTAQLNARMLKRKGYDVLLAYSAAAARAFVHEYAPDLIVLDVGLPDCDGFTLCKEIRQGSDAPVLFLTGRKTTKDKITGMDTGGDYYLTKPCSTDEFIAVTKRLLQKAQQEKDRLNQAAKEAAVITQGPLTLMLPENAALVNGCNAKLTPKEFAVLLLLVKNKGKELTSKVIYENVWGTEMNDDKNAIRMHVSRMKKKLGTDNIDGFSILTGYGGGYTFTTM
ncbi:MAG: response regulator transcription factor [Clostridiales bacterium]|nr:response regulator transcription factor [Clostridiales bacterium]